MGRTAAPAALKLLNGRSEGRDSGGRVVAPPPAFRRLAPKPPSWLSREAKAEWARVVPELTRLDLVKPEDRATLTSYCETWSTLVDAIRQVRREGITIVATSEHNGVKRSRVMKNPAQTVAEAAKVELRRLAQEFGLTPSAESRLVAEGGRGEQATLDDEDNPFVG